MSMVGSASIYSSENTCDVIAKRALRTHVNTHELVGSFMLEQCKPLARMIASAKVVPRGLVAKTASTLVERLKQLEYICNVESREFNSGSKLSSHEHFDLRFSFLTGDAKEQWLQLTDCQIRLSRKKLAVIMGDTTLRLHRHALARIMNRDLLGPDAFFKSLGRATIFATPLSKAVKGVRRDNDIALPFRDGMLLGRIRPRYEADRDLALQGGYMVEITDGGVVPSNLDRDNHSTFIEIMTYVDDGHMTDTRTALRDLLLDFGTNHTKALTYARDKEVFGVFLPDGIAINNDREKERSKPLIREAMAQVSVMEDAAKELVRTGPWQKFTEMDRRHR